MKTLRATRSMVFALLLALTLVLVGSAAIAQDDAPACEGDYLESVRELGLTYIHALNSFDLDSWYEVLADDYVASYADQAFEPLDKDAAREVDEGLLMAFPDLATEIIMSTVSADCRFVTFRWVSRGTSPVNGEGVAVPGMSLVEVENGQILNEWVYYDLLDLNTQMGLMGEAAATEGG